MIKPVVCVPTVFAMDTMWTLNLLQFAVENFDIKSGLT